MSKNEQVYLIPRSLERDFMLFANFSILDVFVALLLLMIACGIAYALHTPIGFLPLACMVVFKTQVQDHALMFWCKAACSFLWSKWRGKGIYYLCEEDAEEIWN